MIYMTILYWLSMTVFSFLRTTQYADLINWIACLGPKQPERNAKTFLTENRIDLGPRHSSPVTFTRKHKPITGCPASNSPSKRGMHNIQWYKQGAALMPLSTKEVAERGLQDWNIEAHNFHRSNGFCAPPGWQSPQILLRYLWICWISFFPKRKN